MGAKVHFNCDDAIFNYREDCNLIDDIMKKLQRGVIIKHRLCRQTLFKIYLKTHCLFHNVQVRDIRKIYN